MKINFRKLTFLFVTVIAVTLTSCLQDDNEPPLVRTLEMEMEEISQVLDQIEENGLNVDTTELGIYYVVDTLGAGPTAQPGDTCYLRYTGYLLDGSVFDDSSYHQQNEGGIWKFVYKENSLIPGFDDGIALMSKGSKIDLFIPSSLGYGANGTLGIPSFATLMFATEMVDLKPAIE